MEKKFHGLSKTLATGACPRNDRLISYACVRHQFKGKALVDSYFGGKPSLYHPSFNIHFFNSRAATASCITGDGAQRNHRTRPLPNDNVAQRRHYRDPSSSHSLNSAFDNAVAARLDDGWGCCPAVALRYTAGYA
jgi:hypothetical protein